MKKTIWLSLLVGFWVFLRPIAAFAVFLDLVPSSPTVVAGQSLNVNIIISDLFAGGPPSVGAFDLDVSFDTASLSPTGVTFGLFLGVPGLETLTDFNFFPGVVDLAEVSLLSSAELDALQPSNFSLATLSFNALASGTTTLEFSEIIVDDAFGNLLLGKKIPEPSSLWLMMSALVGVPASAWLRYRGKHRHRRSRVPR
jgi:PEP-CTERM motif